MDRLVTLLEASPAGLTTEQVVAADGGRPSTIASKLSKLYHWGRINRRPINTKGHLVALWLPKEARP